MGGGVLWGDDAGLGGAASHGVFTDGTYRTYGTNQTDP